MQLPELPKINKTVEADFGLRFRTWWKFNKKRTPTGSYELKETRGKDYLLYSEIKDEQFKSGMANKSVDGNLIRVINGTLGTADYILLKRSCAYIVIRYPNFFCFIDVETLLMERQRSDRKSLTSKRALDIAIIVVK